ncbi:hypothetical protein DFN09_001193 [Clostridium acetobutylicum]|nr:hypothetical protein [Clostridium acetobutylicum]
MEDRQTVKPFTVMAIEGPKVILTAEISFIA